MLRFCIIDRRDISDSDFYISMYLLRLHLRNCANVVVALKSPEQDRNRDREVEDRA